MLVFRRVHIVPQLISRQPQLCLETNVRFRGFFFDAFLAIRFSSQSGVLRLVVLRALPPGAHATSGSVTAKGSERRLNCIWGWNLNPPL